MKNDVYRFRYSEEYLKGKMDLYHCFDGILIERISDGKTYWEDTYWTSGNTIFQSMQQILSKGTLEYIFNMDEVELIDQHQVKYYKECDIFYLPIHKGYRGKHFRKKDSQMSKEVVLKGIAKKIREIESNIEYETRKIEWLKRDMLEIEKGEKELRHASF